MFILDAWNLYLYNMVTLCVCFGDDDSVRSILNVTFFFCHFLNGSKQKKRRSWPTHGLSLFYPHSMVFFFYVRLVTPWKFNMAPENIPSQKESSLPTIIFQGRAVKRREGS